MKHFQKPKTTEIGHFSTALAHLLQSSATTTTGVLLVLNHKFKKAMNRGLHPDGSRSFVALTGEGVAIEPQAMKDEGPAAISRSARAVSDAVFLHRQ